MILKGYLLALLYGALVLLGGALAYRLRLPKPYCRKLVHILIGGEFVILSHHFGTSLHFLIVALGFTLLLLVNLKARLLPMMSSDADNDPGTLYYGVSMSTLALAVHFLPDTLPFFGAAVLLTSLGDGVAGLVGQSIEKYNPRIFGNKSLLGTLSMLLVSILGAIFLRSYLGIGVARAILLAFFVTCVELLCRRGTDNVAVPIGAFLFLLLTDRGALFSEAALGLAFLPLLVVLFLKKRALTACGALAATLIALCLLFALGNFALLFLLVYFLLAHLSDRVARRRLDTVAQKGDCRDASQVLANGFVGALAALLFVRFGHVSLLFGTVAAFSESLADTAASGFGALSRRTYDPFHRRSVISGESGGVSLFGTLAAFLASFLLSFFGAWLFALPFTGALVSSFVAFFGTFVDSALGALFQEKRTCAVCGTVTERHTHCNAPSVHLRGLRWLGNDLVNLLSTVFSALLTVLLCLIV